MTVAAEGPQITVQSVDLSHNGNPIYGYYTELDSASHVKIDSGYTTFTYPAGELHNGTSYYVSADSYGSCTFTRWSDGSTSDPLLVTVSDNIILIADYTCT
jgi:hypothetical protein